ncbi:MAG: hypothetical protein GY795_37120 [Desulfobacterales bacterium]|nr:hypothetical protein [Desulfobacterales bacterium]
MNILKKQESVFKIVAWCFTGAFLFSCLACTSNEDHVRPVLVKPKPGIIVSEPPEKRVTEDKKPKKITKERGITIEAKGPGADIFVRLFKRAVKGQNFYIREKKAASPYNMPYTLTINTALRDSGHAEYAGVKISCWQVSAIIKLTKISAGKDVIYLDLLHMPEIDPRIYGKNQQEAIHGLGNLNAFPEKIAKPVMEQFRIQFRNHFIK